MVINNNIDSKVVEVKRNVLTKLLTCSICNKIFNDPVNITECLHIFCNKCIRKKIEEEYLNKCPVCNVYLGSRPLDKLRPDHHWSSIRATIAPALTKREKKCNIAEGKCKETNVSEKAEQATPVLARRKERSGSSLVRETKLLAPTPMTRKRKTQGRKVSSSHESAISIGKPNKSVEGRSDGSGFTAGSSKSQQNNKQLFCGGSSKQQIPKTGREKTQKFDNHSEGDNNLLKPLNVAEVETITISDKTSLEGHISEKATDISKSEGRSFGKKLRIFDADSAFESAPPSVRVLQPTRKTRGRPKKTNISQELDLNVPAQITTDTESNEPGKRVVPVWLSLVPSVNQEGVEPLPQIPRCYLTIKNPSLPVSYIKKYLVQKLNLDSEDEVEISLFGARLPSDMQLHCLVNEWSKTISKSEKLPAVVGGSAQDFVMVLSYGRPHCCN